ncbi:MAG: hypothetical protein HUJ51_01990 [Eggerthellaceae bacterium]|nr:hypothetical protein [Eggerthellaceae bacterium]
MREPNFLNRSEFGSWSSAGLDDLQCGCKGCCILDNSWPCHAILLNSKEPECWLVGKSRGTKYFQKPFDRRGVLLNSIPGVKPALVIELGGSMARICALQVITEMCASATIIDKSLPRLQQLKDIFRGQECRNALFCAEQHRARASGY